MFLGVTAVALSGEKELLTKEAIYEHAKNWRAMAGAPPFTPYSCLSSWVASSSFKTVQPYQAYSFNQAGPDRSEITISQYTKHPANATTVSRSGAVTIPDLFFINPLSGAHIPKPPYKFQVHPREPLLVPRAQPPPPGPGLEPQRTRPKNGGTSI